MVRKRIFPENRIKNASIEVRRISSGEKNVVRLIGIDSFHKTRGSVQSEGQSIPRVEF